MNVLEQILCSNDDVLFCEEAGSETLQIPNRSDEVHKTSKNLEEGEIDEWYSVCTGFFFDTSIMKKVPGCAECHNGKYCCRPRKV